MSASPLDLVREDLRDFRGYASARSTDVDGDAWLNANESPWPNPADGPGHARRYPDPQPAMLRRRLAELYGCDPAQLLVGRGSDEGIDLLVRALCRPGMDAVLTTPPTFGMYAICARLHGVRLVEVPLVDGAGQFSCDFDAVARAAEEGTVKLVFLCSPGNPSGNALALDAIEDLARRLRDTAVVVVDEAYLEYAGQASAITLLQRQRNIAVLRTLSKAHALAGARIGCVVADADLIALLRRCQPPYPLPRPSVDIAMRALQPSACRVTAAHVQTVLAERDRMKAALAGSSQVRTVYGSRANFLLVRFVDAQAAFDRLLAAGIVVRDLRSIPGLSDALRITIGSPAQNTRAIEAVASLQTDRAGAIA